MKTQALLRLLVVLFFESFTMWSNESSNTGRQEFHSLLKSTESQNIDG